MPLILYSLEDLRKHTKDLTGHSYTPQALRKAIDQKKLHCYWMGKHPLVSPEDLRVYLDKYGRWKPKEGCENATTSRNVDPY